MRVAVRFTLFTAGVLLLNLTPQRLQSADSGTEWQRVVATAKKEGKVVIGAPPGTDFRHEVQAVLV
jgi:nucleoside 2-deoxyribosyltransferase